jgi:hypothetical protein
METEFFTENLSLLNLAFKKNWIEGSFPGVKAAREWR